MALEHAVLQEAVSKECQERGPAESPTALDRSVEQEAVQQEAAALTVLEAASGRSAESGSDSAALDSRSAAGLGPAPGSSAEPGSASSDAEAPMALGPETSVRAGAGESEARAGSAELDKEYADQLRGAWDLISRTAGTILCLDELLGETGSGSAATAVEGAQRCAALGAVECSGGADGALYPGSRGSCEIGDPTE